MLLYILQGIKLRTSTESYAPVQNTTATSNLLYVRRLREGEKELKELQTSCVLHLNYSRVVAAQ